LTKKKKKINPKQLVQKKRKRTVWVHDLWGEKRKTEGKFTLYNGLIDDEQQS